jgi:4-amino-4-deoxy-L-arabinose transferase-like glycosyltransferase
MAKGRSKVTKSRARAPAVVLDTVASKDQAVLAWLRQHSFAVFLLLVVIASLRIVATYTVFNHTIDEPFHIACGMEWLTKGVYKYATEQPPLSGVVAALGPYLIGVHGYGKPGVYQEGAAILSADGHYDRNLALSRLGILPFFWIAALVVYLWAKRYFDEPIATLAVLFFTFLPPILAHAGLATTDMGLTAFVGASFLAGVVWIDKPTLFHSLLFGVCTGFAMLSKFSSWAFLPCSMAAALLWFYFVERPDRSRIVETLKKAAPQLCIAILVACVLVWAGYRFSFGKVWFANIKLPAPELFDGIRSVSEHNNQGHPAYLLGQRSQSGWWYYYFVVLAVKTPLAFLAFLVYGAILSWRGRSKRGAYLALAFAAGILLFSLFSRINIGVRHILPVYIGFSIVAAVGAGHLLEMSRTATWAGWTLSVLLLWLIATSALSHPDYIPYFNALAGDEPEKILVDSDLDWGQDMKRLSKRLKEVGARQVAFNPFIVAYLEAVHGFPPIQPTDPVTPSPGWNAVSLTELKTTRLGLYDDHPEVQLWPDQIRPTEKVSPGVWLWYFPPNAPIAR